MPAASVSRCKKPKKPRRDFPLYAHANGSWCKQVHGKKRYFGPWSDPKAAEALWDAQKERLLAGLEPDDLVATSGSVDVEGLCQQYLLVRQTDVATGDLTSGYFKSLLKVCRFIVSTMGARTPLDAVGTAHFAKAKQRLVARNYSPRNLKRWIVQIRGVFNFAMEEGLTERVIRFGAAFKLPKEETIARHDLQVKRDHGDRDFSVSEIRVLLDKADYPGLAAWIALGANAGMGTADVGRMTFGDLDGRWFDSLRWKTSTPRRFYLWPETRKHIDAYLPQRPEPRDPRWRELIFLTTRGTPIYRPDVRGAQFAGYYFTEYTKRHGLYLWRRGFHGLRKSFETMASGCLDQQAIDMCQGHKDPTISAGYRQRIDDKRLIAVSEFVRKQVFGRRKAK